MKDFSNPCPSDTFFFSFQSSSEACVVWKVKYFSTLKEESYQSPVYSFKNVKWYLTLHPFGEDNKLEWVSLFLTPVSAFPSKLKFRFFCDHECAEDVTSNDWTVERDFSDGVGFGDPEFLHRQDMDGNILPDDILTIRCKMKIVDHSEIKTEASTGVSNQSNPSQTFNLSAGKDSFFSNFRGAFDSGSFSDVVLRVGEETMPAHKVILSSHSEVFKGMFQSDMKESRDNTVDLVDMDFTVGKAMLLYMYTRQVEEFSPEKTLELYVAADRYMLTELKEKCREYLSNNLSSKIVGDVFEIANFHSDKVLSEAAQKFFAGNAKRILKSKEWEEFVVKKPSSSIELLSFAIKSNPFF